MNRRKATRPQNAERREWFRISNKADSPATAQIDIYDEIDWYWGVSAVDFRDQLKALGDITTIDLHINSPGGDVYEAIAIMNTLRQHNARVVTTVDGLAASSAGFIAVGASDELTVAENAEIMAHLPWSIMIGDANDMRKTADDLDRIGRNIASIFATRAGGTVDDWMQVLADETWWSAQECVDAGIADRVLAVTKRDTTSSTKDRFDLSVFNHAGRGSAPAPRIVRAHNQTPQPVEAEETNGKEPLVATLSESALRKLGLDAAADEAAVDAAIAALADTAADGPETAAEPTAEQVQAVAAKHGLTVMDKTVHDQLVAQARDGAEARAQQIREQDDATIHDALTSGRITPASEQVWRKNLADNREGTRSLLATLPANTALAVSAVGHGVDTEGGPIDAEQASVYARITGKTVGKDA